jgi:mRNA interferase YafQ
MLKANYSHSFWKDQKRIVKRGWNIDNLRDVIKLLIQEIPLPGINKEHVLKGDYAGHNECHIAPDWLLIYYKDKDRITFVRTGSHSDLF